MTEKEKYGRVTTLRIPKDLWILLEKEADHNFTSVSSVVIKAIAHYYESKGEYSRKK